MRIGILSMQQIKNYGSFLQAFSLKKNIENLGHSCEFINIEPGIQLDGYKQKRSERIRVLITRLWGIDFLKRLKYIYKFQTRFSKEFLPYLGVKNTSEDKNYDTVVIGSDEVFNVAQSTWWGFSKQLFGHGLNSDKVISYAGSFGATTIEKIEKLGIKEDISCLMSNMDTISVRDRNSYEVASTLTDKSISLNVDPVFIFDYDQYMPFKVGLKDYIIVYTYPGRIKEKSEIQEIVRFAREKKKKLVSIGHYFPWCDMTLIPSPFEVLAYFREASYIITDTFHGTIFSIKYNKPFCTIVRGMNNNKLTFLLEQFKLAGREVKAIDSMSEILNTPIDYKVVNNIIIEEKDKSIEYLRNNL